MTKYCNYNQTEQYDITFDYQGATKMLKNLLKSCKSMHYYEEDDPTYGELSQDDEISLVKAINNARFVDKLCFIDERVDDESNNAGESDFDLREEQHFVLEFPESNRTYNFDLFDANRTTGKNKIIKVNISELLKYAQKSHIIFSAKYAPLYQGKRFVWFDDDSDVKKLLTDKPDLEHDFYGSDLNKLCHDLLYGIVLDIKPIKTPNKNKTTRHILFSEPICFEHDLADDNDDSDLNKFLQDATNENQNSDKSAYFDVDKFLLDDCHLTKLPAIEQVKITKEKDND